MYGGSISAITLNTPGTNSAIATTFDGYPLAKQGKVKKALDASLFASVFGGLFSAVLLLLCASLITKLVANFTSVEYFSLGIMGISLIAGVSGLEATKRIVAERPVPVLILTARDDEADKVKIGRASCRERVSSPV